LLQKVPMTASIRSLCASALLLAGALPAQAIVGGTATQSFGPVDSGVQITDSWVLTARHVSYAQGGSYSNGYGSATIAARYDLGGGPTLVNDLALLRLATPIAAPALTLLADLPPVQVFNPRPDVTIATGSNQEPRGYAFAGLAEVIDEVDVGTTKAPNVQTVHWWVVYNADQTAPYVQGGDSGGGLFWGHVTDSTGSLLMGITSAQLTFDNGGFGSGFVQLAAYRSWITDTMAIDHADAQVAQWASAVPEPTTWALWLAGAGLLVGRRARRGRAATQDSR
jgi:hypothetical protein